MIDLSQANYFLETPVYYKPCFSYNCIHKVESPDVWLIAELTDYMLCKSENMLAE